MESRIMDAHHVLHHALSVRLMPQFARNVIKVMLSWMMNVYNVYQDVEFAIQLILGFAYNVIRAFTWIQGGYVNFVLKVVLLVLQQQLVVLVNQDILYQIVYVNFHVASVKMENLLPVWIALEVKFSSFLFSLS